MQNLITLLVRGAILFLLMLCAALVFGQDTIPPTPTAENPFVKGTNVQLVLTWYDAVYSGLIMALTYIQGAFFPKAGSIPKVAVRYILIAAVVGILFVVLGFSDAWGVVIGFVGSSLAYDKILKPIGLSTPQPKLAATTQ
jgi:hypothetical protein